MKNYKTLIINLKRRTDRNENMKNIFNSIPYNDYIFYEAFDGKNMEVTYEMKYLFEHNDFYNRKGVICCALSHYNIWIDLTNDNDSDYYIIFEDDITILDNFTSYLDKAKDYINIDIDFLFLGYLSYKKKDSDNNFKICDLDRNHYIGGFHSYIITKKGAHKILNTIKNNGIKHGIDYLIKIDNSLIIKVIDPLIVHAEWYNSENKIDTDIQSNHEAFDLSYIKFNPKINKVKMLCNWCNSISLCNEWNNLSKGDFQWNNIKIVSSDDDIDYYVIINKPLDNSYYNPAKTIIFQMEPWVNNPLLNWGVKTWGEWAIPDESKFLEVRSHKNYYNNCAWQINVSYNELMTTEIFKNYNISTICSSKYNDVGHIKRIDFLKFLENKNDSCITIDIYGQDNKHGFKNYIKPLDQDNKKDGIIHYKYYFMVENNSEYNYITEKLWEPIISECLCFYWGAPNLSDYIDKRAYVNLNLDDFEESYNIMKNAITNDLWSERIDIIRAEKYKILNYYNFFPTVERIITKDLHKDNLIRLKDNIKIYVLQTEKELNYKIIPFINTMKEFNFNIDIYNYFDKNKLKIENINNSNDKKIIYDKNNIKYTNLDFYKIKDIFKKIQLFEYILETTNNYNNYNNYLIIDGNLELNGSLDDLFNYMFFLPDNYDYCQLHFDEKPLINAQYNLYYYSLKKYLFKMSSAYMISRDGIKKILIHIKNYIKYELPYLMFECYKNIENFNVYTMNIDNQIFE